MSIRTLLSCIYLKDFVGILSISLALEKKEYHYDEYLCLFDLKAKKWRIL